MDTPRKINIGNNDYEDVIKHGFFIKSPPDHFFSNQTSWKKRYFVLSKSSENGCLLRYLKGHQVKGCIEINESSIVEIGIGDTEKMSVVKKMFKCQATEVMTIKTENRIFYLIGTDSKLVEDWATFLFASCRGKEKTRSRSTSLPSAIEELQAAATAKDNLCPGKEYEEETETTSSKKRPTSAPTFQGTCEEKHIYESPRKLLSRPRRLTTAPLEESLDESVQKESHYAYPRSVLAQLDGVIAGISTVEQSTSSDGEKLSNEYVHMKGLLGFTKRQKDDIITRVTEKDIQSACTENESQILSQCKKNSSNTQVSEDNLMKPTPLLQTSNPTKDSRVSLLSVVQLSIILSKIIMDDNQLEDVDIILPRVAFPNCLTLLEVYGHICISQWKDEHHLGCIFHQGDYIVTVNDLHVKSIDEISLFTIRSTRKEVKLTVRRLPDSDILHAKGCKCSYRRGNTV